MAGERWPILRFGIFGEPVCSSFPWAAAWEIVRIAGWQPTGTTQFGKSYADERCLAAEKLYLHKETQHGLAFTLCVSTWLDRVKRFGGNTMQLSSKRFFSLFAVLMGFATIWFLRIASAYKKWAKNHYKIGDSEPR